MPLDQQDFELPSDRVSGSIPDDEVLRDLIAARAKVEKPENWCQGRYQQDEAYCAWGAVNAVTGRYMATACDYLDRASQVSTHYFCAAELNDHPDTTHADILALFDRAIAARRAEQAT